MSNTEVLTKADLRKCLNRYVMVRQAPFNYETMQSGGFVYAMQPAIEKLYDDEDVIADKYRSYLKFYNTHPWMGNLILAVCIAIEQTKDPNATKTAVDMRTALMGPLAGLGDSIIWIMPMTVLGAIAGYMALEGSILGWVIAECIQLVIWFTFYNLYYVAYKQGVTFVTSRSKQLAHLTEAASVIGLSVIGALVASTVNVHTAIQLSYGEVSQSLDDLLNTIIPNFMNVVAMLAIYLGLGVKKMSSGKMVVIVIVLGIVLSMLGILA
ncbi:MAG: PTS system mannose/fructose/sorbose family transporter subunit IID [Traorella sp.]